MFFSSPYSAKLFLQRDCIATFLHHQAALVAAYHTAMASSMGNTSPQIEKDAPNGSSTNDVRYKTSNNKRRSRWAPWGNRTQEAGAKNRDSTGDGESIKKPKKWTGLGMLNDTETEEVPGIMLQRTCKAKEDSTNLFVKAPFCFYPKCRIATNHSVCIMRQGEHLLLPYHLHILDRAQTHVQTRVRRIHRNQRKRRPMMARLSSSRNPTSH